VPRTLDEARQQIREAGDITGHPDRAAAEIARLDAALARARRAVSERHYSRAAIVAARLGGGQRQFYRLAARRNRLRSAAGPTSGFAFGGFASLEAIVNLRPTSSWFRRQATLRETTARRFLLPFRRWSVFIRRRSAS